jgi:hypothetical protein
MINPYLKCTDVCWLICVIHVFAPRQAKIENYQVKKAGTQSINMVIAGALISMFWLLALAVLIS